MADDDDDDSFGDFIASNHTVSSQISSTAAAADDDWSDFNFVQNNTTDHNIKSPQPLPQPQTPPQWGNMRGAFPLSLFGGEEEEEEEAKPVNPSGGGFKRSDFAGNGGFESNNGNKNVNSNGLLEINDLIASLYGQKPQQRIVKKDDGVNYGNGLDFNVIKSSASTGSLLRSDALGSSSLNTVGASDAKDQESDDEDGWEFRDAYSGLNNVHTGDDNKEHSKDAAHPLGLRGGSLGSLDLFATPNNGVFGQFHETDNGFNSDPITSAQNGFALDFKTDQKSTANGLNSNSVGESDDSDDNFGDFETAFSKQASKQKGSSKETFLSEFDTGFNIEPSTSIQNGFSTELNFQTEWKDIGSVTNTHPLAGNVDSDKNIGEFDAGFQKAYSEGNIFQLGSHANSQGSFDLFALPNGVSAESHDRDNGFDFSRSSVVQSSFSNPNFQTERKDTKENSDSQPRGVSADSDENFGKFENAFPEAGSKPQGYEASQKNYKEPVPLSIFGIEEPEADDSLNLQDEFLFKPSTQRKNMLNKSSNLSIDDLSDLYRRAEPICPVHYEYNPAGKENVLEAADGQHSSHTVDDDNFDDGSWEFKVALSQSRVENQNLSFNNKLKNCMDFYSKIKDELCGVARHHLHSLKKAKNDAALAGEEMKVAALNKEIQEAFEELRQENIISTEGQLDDHSERVGCLKQYTETLNEQNFQVLDSEYHISRRLSLAESDLRTAIDLIKQFTTMLKILLLAPEDEPANYVSVWCKVVSVCAQELKHGTWIWKQSLEKNVRSEILSEPQGEQFILALGEIYRAVVIFGACVKFYKPWILLSSADLAEYNALLEECHSLWSTSGFEEAIPSKSLLESIRHIQDLDAVAVANESQQEHLCRLSLLSQGVVPEMKMVVWNGDKYFVTLANLWANSISPNPPKLTSTHVD